jgi:phosphorylcholine metabolism protein LicD
MEKNGENGEILVEKEGEFLKGFCDTGRMIKLKKDSHLDLVKKLMIGVNFLREAEISDWWIDCGTLLGCWRNGKFIQNDVDIDFAYEDRTKTQTLINNIQVNDNWNAISLLIEKQDCVILIEKNMICDKAKKEDTNKLISNLRNYIDFHTFYEENNYYKHEVNFYDKDKSYLIHIPMEYIFPLKTMVLEGIEVNVPNDTISYLECIYGYLGEDNYFDQTIKKYKKKEN